MNLKYLLQKNSPGILSLLGVAGFVTATVMVAKIAPIANDILVEEKQKTFKEKAKRVFPLYAPSIGLMLISSGCIFAANKVSSKRYSSLLALYAISEQGFKKLQQSALEELGEKKYNQIKDKFLTPTEEIPEEFTDEDDPRGILFYDTFTGRFFASKSLEAVRRVINDMNEDMYSSGFVDLNSFYYGVGLPPTDLGNHVGWHVENGSINVEFWPIMHNGRPISSVSFKVNPRF